jgi:hypothetical protein
MKSALYVAWRNQAELHHGWGPVGRLEYEDGLYRFYYTRGAKTLEGFKPFSEMPDLDEVYESYELFPLFANRLLGEQRPEYERFLQWGGFEPHSQPHPISILGVSEGKKATDSVEVFPCPVPENGCYVNRFFVHGMRWMSRNALQRVATLEANEKLFLMLDLQNPYDSKAVAIRTGADRIMLGYVPRYLAAEVWELFGKCDPKVIELTVDRVNPDAPLQQRILCRMRACWPEGFFPCDGEAFHPIRADVSASCG